MDERIFWRGARKQGLFALLLALAAYAASAHLAPKYGYVDELVFVGFVSLAVGLAQLLFPGSKDLPMMDAGPNALANSLAGLTRFELAAWICAGVLGCAAGLYFVITH